MRLEDWADRYLEAIALHARLPFEWGVSDCLLLPMDVCAAITGEVPATFKRGSYHTMSDAVRELRALGFAHLGDAFAANFEEIPPAFAQRGDIGIADYPGAILGGGVVVIGDELIGKGEQGLVRLPRDAMVRAFRIG